MNFLKQVTQAFEPEPDELNAAGVNLTGFAHYDVLTNIEDRRLAGFTEREIDEILRREHALKPTSAASPAAVSQF